MAISTNCAVRQWEQEAQRRLGSRRDWALLGGGLGDRIHSARRPWFGGGPFPDPVNWLPTGSTWHQFGFAVDPLTALMLFMVPFVCMLIFVYAVGYMGVGKSQLESDRPGAPATPGHVDPLASRFFAFISLFAGGMLGTVLADNLIILLIFWEIMGLCSYLLIGFWWARKYADPQADHPQASRSQSFPHDPDRRHGHARRHAPAACAGRLIELRGDLQT